ncbi:MAG: hypothetical protein NC918_07165 [Candidatus Omnitrophica bacterium]|nr:hypothetical protein [Candidatus Omnitrophota bacterium]
MKKGYHKFTRHGTHVDAIIPEARPGAKAGNEFIDKIIELGKMAHVNAEMIAYTLHPYVNFLIAQKSSESREIERTLDSLLEAMMFGKGDKDFMRLVRYYLGVDREGANYYHNSALDDGLLSQMKHPDELRSLDLPTDEYAIFGSGPMAVRGIRRNNDINVVVSNEIWDRFSEENTGNKIKIGHIEICCDWKPYFPDNLVLISNSEMIGDFRYVKLPRVLEWKKQSKRRKDREDVLLIKEYLSFWSH